MKKMQFINSVCDKFAGFRNGSFVLEGIFDEFENSVEMRPKWRRGEIYYILAKCDDGDVELSFRAGEVQFTFSFS